MVTYLGAEGARELIAWLDGEGERHLLERRPDPGTPPRTLSFRRPSPPSTVAVAPGPVADPPAAAVEAPLLDRHVLDLGPAPLRPARDVPEPAPGELLILTNATGLRTPPGAVTLTVAGTDDETLAARLAEVRPRHVRVVADLAGLDAPGWSDAARAVLRLHEWAFLAAQACAGWFDAGSSFLVTVLGGVTSGGVPTPYTGLFTGFVKSLALEWPDTPVVATVHEPGDTAAAVAEALAELGAAHYIPVVYRTGGRRLTPRFEMRPATESTVEQLTPDSLVLAAGGARGIGAAALVALAGRYRPRMVILGSSPPPEPVADGDPADRAAYIRRAVTGPEKLTVQEANARFDRLADAATVRANLDELERLCGPGRVHYLRCDLRDSEAVAATVGGVLDAHGDIDLLVNIAGTNRAADIRSKTRQDFLTVRDLKVRTYLNLKDALRARPPRRWCNFGSFVGFTGQRGESDYASANDFLNTAAAASSGVVAGSEFTIGWTLWRDVGLGASPIMQAFLGKSEQFTATPTEEGVAHFLAEIAHPSPEPATVFFGAKERAAMTEVVPGYLEFCARRPLSYVDDVRRDGPDQITVRRTFDLARDGYLDLHQVYDYPTLPGTFVPELAAQAALALVPHRVPVVFEHLRLESFLRVYGADRPVEKRMRARLVRSDDLESVVDVQVLGDVVGPAGRVLVRDKLHFSVTVRMRDAPTPSPSWAHWDEHGSRPLRDPYHAPGSAVLLRDVFVSTKDTRLHPLGRRGTLALDKAGIQRWFPDLVVPSVMLDGLVRVAVMELVEDDWIPVAIPRYIRRIDLYGGHTDASLAASGLPVELYVTPVDLNIEDEQPDNRAIAVGPDGEVILQVKDIIGAIVGYVHQESGRYVSRADFGGKA
jgi:NAD(P)-dependent dehydrogenase (short-subunit alcohol dehydrogenase family)